MRFAKFGHTGLTVSRMILGTGTFGKQTDEKEAQRMLDKAAEAGINFIDLAGGLLSGKYKHGDTPDKGRFSAELGGFGQAYHARYWHEREFETVARVQEIAKQHETPITTLSVAWVLANPAITSVILGASRVEQLTDTMAAADYKLDSALKTRLDEVSIEFRRGDAGK